MILCKNERKMSDACVADPFARAKEALIGPIHSPYPGRGASSGSYPPGRNLRRGRSDCQSSSLQRCDQDFAPPITRPAFNAARKKG